MVSEECIVFLVNFEVDYLHVLQRRLYEQRRIWDMCFVGSADEAWDEICKNAVDVLVYKYPKKGVMR